MRGLQPLRRSLPRRGLHHHGATNERQRRQNRPEDQQGLRQLDHPSEQSHGNEGGGIVAAFTHAQGSASAHGDNGGLTAQ